MALTDIAQMKQLIEESKHILITFRRDADIDTIASAVALFAYLEKQGNRVDVVSSGFTLPNKISFLPNTTHIKHTFEQLQKLVVTIDIEKTGVSELSYDQKNGKLRIFVSPKEGALSGNNVKTAKTAFRYDLIITLDTPDLVSLGDLYHQHTDLFFDTPIINIDANAANERYGQINTVDTTATSTAEHLYQLLRKVGDEYINKDVATALLTGMIAKTQSFKTNDIKPSTLTVASKLIELGADREYIIQNLYRTRSVAALKLWGQALSYLESHPEIGLVSTTITRDDFLRSGASQEDLYDIVHELITSSPDAKLVLLMHEHLDGEKIKTILHAGNGYHAKDLLKPFNASGDANRATCQLTKKQIKQAYDIVLAHLKQTLDTKN